MAAVVDYVPLISYCQKMIRLKFGGMPFVDELVDLASSSVFEAVSKYEPRGASLKSFCIIVSLSRCRDYLRRHFLNADGSHKPEYTVDTEIPLDCIPVESPNYDIKLTLEALLSLLAQDERRLLEMIYFEQRSQYDIARMFGVSHTTICMRKIKILHRLRAVTKRDQLKIDRSRIDDTRALKV